MFSKKEIVTTDANIINDLKQQLVTNEHNHQLKLKELEAENKLALKEKEFELRHFKDNEMKTLANKLSEREKEIAVLKKENEMLNKITNLNADIIDIKDLVANLINKLPEVKINSLSVHSKE